MKLLIIEDERQLSDSIVSYLGQEDYLCEQAFTYHDAMMRVGVYEYDCVLLALMLPGGGNGLDILRRIKRTMPQTGIIIVSAKDSLEDKVEGLQTPLAVVCGKLDLLMQEDLTKRQMELVADLYELTMRMGKLNRNLLLLAKIENAQYATTDDVDLMGMLQEAQRLVGTLQGRVTLRVDDRRTDRTATLRANSVLLECLLKNLIVNAMRHSAYGCEVQIELDDERMHITNPAADGKPLDTQKLFHRFSSGDVSDKGNGLGLAIVKAICDFHHWSVEYSFEDGRHGFVVCFKG